MGKPALGRGLGRLMNGDSAVKPANGRNGNAGTAPSFGRGLETLVAPAPEAKQRKEGTAPRSPETAPGKQLLPAWFFFAADLLLLAFVVAILFDAPKPLALRELFFAAVVTGVAAAFGLIGLAVAVSQDE